MSNKTLFSSIALAVLLPFCAAAGPALQHVGGRSTTPLDGPWRAIVDPYENGWYNYRMQPMDPRSTFFADRHFYADQTKLVEYDFDAAGTLEVPGDWNTQREKLYYYEGTVWYRRLFDAAPQPGHRYFIHFDGANYETLAALNGQLVGQHVGGFTAFDFEVTEQLRAGQNSLCCLIRYFYSCISWSISVHYHSCLDCFSISIYECY